MSDRPDSGLQPVEPRHNGLKPIVSQSGPGLYVHIPFCIRKCPYCDFASVPLPHPAAGGYVDAVLAEAMSLHCPEATRRPRQPHPPALRQAQGRSPSPLAERGWSLAQPGAGGEVVLAQHGDDGDAVLAEAERDAAGWAFPTVFVGGGTPTALPADDLSRLLRGLRSVCHIAPDAEVTVEANPGTLDARKVEALADRGATRLSIGVQSFNDLTLRTLGRIHLSADAVAAIELASSFPSFSVDLMFGVPGQSVADAVADASQAVDLGAQHVSAYALTYEAGTPLERSVRAGRVARLPEDVELRMFESVGATLEAAGLARYEVSNFARPGSECAHNLNYWKCGEYVGLGAAAHSHTADERRWNVSDPTEYQEAVLAGRSPVAGREPLTPRSRYLEHLMLGLRMTRGVEWATLRQLADAAGEADLLTRVRLQAERGLVELAGEHLRLTGRGLLVADSVIAALA